MEKSERISANEVMHLMLNAVCVVDAQGRFEFVSAAFTLIFGYSPQEVVGTSVIDYVCPDDREKTLAVVGSVMSGDSASHFENRWVRKDGQVVHVLWTARWSDTHQARIAVAHDITERKQTEERLRHMSGHDSLTGLTNRALLFDRLNTALKIARRNQSELAVLFIDIDGFKQVNDTHGHITGDALLQALAERLTGCVRESDTIGRLGGDEFVVLISGVDAQSGGANVAEKIRQALAEPIAVGPLLLQIAPSIGVARFPHDGIEATPLVQWADQAMYQAKNSGGNRVAFG